MNYSMTIIKKVKANDLKLLRKAEADLLHGQKLTMTEGERGEFVELLRSLRESVSQRSDFDEYVDDNEYFD